jgi:DNA-directed RNA polymerase subunit K/omega
LNRFGNIDSKFRFVILASKRAKQLLKGAKPKVKAKSRNPIRLAQSEVRSGVIEYEILPMTKDEVIEQEDRIFVGEGIHEEAPESEDAGAGKGVAPAEAEAPDDVDEDGAEEEEESSEDEEAGDIDDEKDE